MSDNTNDAGTSAAKRPSHIAYQVRDGDNDKSYFNKVGAAWAHQDGQGYNIQLDSVPVDGRITLRTPMERLDDMRNQPQPDPQVQETQATPEPQKADQEVER